MVEWECPVCKAIVNETNPPAYMPNVICGPHRHECGTQYWVKMVIKMQVRLPKELVFFGGESRE